MSNKMLVIAEKKAAALNMAQVLGVTEKHDGYMEGSDIICTWAQGHLVGLKEPHEHDIKYKTWKLEDLPLIFPIETNLKVTNPSVFKIIKDLIHRSDVFMIINAGDAGTEGELIQRWIYKMAGNKKPVKRLWCSTLTDDAIKEAFNNLLDSSKFDSLFEAAEARAELDQFYGYNYSRALSLTKTNDVTLAYGRCQTTLLNKIVERDFEVENFVPEEYWSLKASFSAGTDKNYIGSFVGDSDKSVHFSSYEDALKVSSALSSRAKISDFQKEVKKVDAPLLFNLNKLQRYMARKYKFSSDKTLSLAQSLYEKKIMSYPRTSSEYLSTDLKSVINDSLKCLSFGVFSPFVEKVFDSSYSVSVPNKYFNDKKVTDHHAIIPAFNEEVDSIYSSLSADEKLLFDTIAKSFISIYFPKYEYESVSVVTLCSSLRFLTRGTSVVSLGWKEVFSSLDDDKKDNSSSEEGKIPNLTGVVDVSLADKDILSDYTKPKKHFSEDKLLELMEIYGIGTSSTQSEIILKLLSLRGANVSPYVERVGGYFVSTSFGRDFISVVPEFLKDISFISKIDSKLKEIEDGGLSKDILMSNLVSELRTNLSTLVGLPDGEKLSSVVVSEYNCPVCHSSLLKKAWGYKCSLDTCSFSLSSVCGVKLKDSHFKALFSGKKTSLVKNLKFKSGSSSDAYLFYDSSGALKFEFPKSGSSSKGSVSKKVSPGKVSSDSRFSQSANISRISYFK